MSDQISKEKPFNFGGTVVTLSLLAMVAKACGFGEKIVIARYFGTSASADIYFATTGFVLSIVFLVKELVNPTLLPVFSKSLKDGPMTSARLLRAFLFICIAVLLVFGIAMTIFSEQLIHIIVPGFSPEKKEQASIILKYLMPACIFLSLSMVTYTILNAHRTFMKAAVPETLYKVFVLIGFLMLVPLFDLKAIPLVLCIASIMLFVLMIIYIPENTLIFKRDLGNSKELSRVFKLMGPIAMGVIFSHISELVDNMLASMLPTGHLSYLGYSKKLIDAVLLIGPVALVTVSYSQLANLYHQSTEGYIQLFVKILRVLIYIGIPGTILIVFLREPIVQLLFESGKFDYNSTVGTSRGLLIYGFGFLFLSLQGHLVCSFYAFSDTKTPVTIGIICVIIDIVLAVSLIKFMGYMGIALAFVVSKSVKVLILGYFLERKFNFFEGSELLLFISKIISAAFPSTLLLLYLCRFESGGSLFSKGLVELIVPAAGFIVLYFVFSHILKIEEAKQLKIMFLRRVRT